MKIVAAVAAMLAALITGATAQVVSLEFLKDSCDKFLKSEPSDQQMYLWWGTSRISKALAKDPNTAGIKIDDAAASQALRDYCTTHPATAFVDATDTVKVQLSGAAKP